MKKKTPLWVPVLWFLIAGIWAAAFCGNLAYRLQADWIIGVEGLTALVSLGAGAINLVRWRRQKEQK